MNIKKASVLLCAFFISSGVFADELHDKAMTATHDLQQAVSEMRLIHQEHGDEFGGHMGKATALAEQAEKERNIALEYYRARHPGWR